MYATGNGMHDGTHACMHDGMHDGTQLEMACMQLTRILLVALAGQECNVIAY